MKMNDVNYEELSPMMKQYYDIKKNYLDILLFYRLGDFYELFFEDASIASRILGLTLTGKNAGLKERVPMCGVPYHSVKNYIKDALKQGYKVAICEQMEDPKLAKGTVKREVTEVISKGTMTDLEFLDNKDFNYLGSILKYPASYVVTWADISTGELNTTTISSDEKTLLNLILDYGFKEVITNSNVDSKFIDDLKKVYNIDVEVIDEVYTEELPFIEDNNLDLKTIKGIRHILYYLSVRELKDISHFDKVNIVDESMYLDMDIHTIRNLELFETMRTKERQNSLIWLIDKCKTSMGSRRLKSWMLKPLKNKEEIESRYDKISKLNNAFIERSNLMDLLYEIYDIERLCGKITCGSANAKDLLQLKNSLRVLPGIKSIISALDFPYEIDTFDGLYNLIDRAISEDAPITLKEGYLIKDGYNSELDELKSIRLGGKNFISSLEEKAKKTTGIANLKVGYNKVFGYYIEVTNANKDKITSELGWIRKQTLVNAERYISPELKEKENMILNAEEKIIDMEYNLFIEVRNAVKSKVHDLIVLSSTLSEIDALVSLSVVSEDLHLTRPTINDSRIIDIKESRHPVVEYVSDREFVPNDIKLSSKTNTLLITGPNMSGKSTYMRSLAIIVVLAQMGSFVPAKSANIPIFDKIFTRIGASDDLVSGDSTFMVEMKEANNAITNATENSLILFDELGRGTATYDGMSLAQAILEYIESHIACKTLFSTHYHELTHLAQDIPSIKNIHVSAKEQDGELFFLHKVEDGPVDKSYGIHVASLAGMPDELIKRAEVILKSYEEENKLETPYSQLSFNFNEPVKQNTELIDTLKRIDPNSITPKEALDMIYILKEMIKD